MVLFAVYFANLEIQNRGLQKLLPEGISKEDSQVYVRKLDKLGVINNESRTINYSTHS